VLVLDTQRDGPDRLRVLRGLVLVLDTQRDGPDRLRGGRVHLLRDRVELQLPHRRPVLVLDGFQLAYVDRRQPVLVLDRFQLEYVDANQLVLVLDRDKHT
jgi:hypothetical protein